MIKKLKFEKNLVEKIKNTENLWKKRTRGNCEAEASPQKKQNSEDPSGSIRDITAHLIHDKNTSIEVSCTVFNEESAGNDPRWIHWSYEFLFFRPRGLRTWTQRPAQTGPGCQNLAFQRFEPIIIHDFSRRFRKTTLEKHSSKQMMVYEQIDKKSIFFQNGFLTSESIF